MEINTVFRQTLASKFEEALDKQMSLNDIREICTNNKKYRKRLSTCCCWIVLPILLAVVCAFIATDVVELNELNNIYDDLKSELEEWECLVEQNEISMEVTRPLFDCNLCKDLRSIPIENDISREKFESTYAFTGVPLVVRNGAKNWTAKEVFSVRYFRDIYTKDEKSIDMANEQCQFLPYYTEWENLGEALNMTDDEANLKGSHWYIGWSNCVPDVEEELRKHYRKPEFLPQSGGNVHIDWIFMGGSGPGAPSHIDSVGRPSWQAQLRGKKTWYLDPAPECDSLCHSLSVTMNSGDIIVLDTDIWYHSTLIHPGEISITIGSEYD